MIKLRQLFCAHRFKLDDMKRTGNEPPTRPSATAGIDEWEAYWYEYHYGDWVNKRVRWPCSKCGKVFVAACGLDILQHGKIITDAVELSADGLVGDDSLPREAHPPKLAAWFVIIITLAALAWPLRGCVASEAWTTPQKVAEGTYLVLHTVDWAQTRWMTEQPPGRWHESFNTVLGQHPNTHKVDRYFLTTTLLQPLLADALPAPYRELFIGFGVGLEVTLTTHNAQIGVKMSLP